MLTLLLLTILQFSAFVALPETAFWDNNDWPSDLTPVHGDGPLLEGTVLFAQSQIMPSKNGIPGDQQPHLTASRKSLVMLRPHTIQNDSVRMEMTVRSRDGTILSGEKPIVMSPPEDIPKHDGWIDLGKLEIDFPSKLDNPYIVQGQNNLDTIVGSLEGNEALRSIFNDIRNQVEVKTQDGSWVERIHLPNGSSVPENSRFQLTCDSTWSLTVKYRSVNGWASRLLSTGETLVIVMVNNLWVAEGDPSPDDVPKFPTSLESPYLVRGQSSMDIIGNDKDGLGLREILNDESKTPTNEVDIRTQNGSWVRYLYLPDASTVPHDSTVQILCDSAWGFTLYYPNIRTGGYRQRILSTGDLVTLVVTSDKKQWVAKDDLRHNSYVFGHNFYTATLLPEWVQPGLKLEFAASSGEKGVLEATVGGFTELIITTLDAGFLTEPRNEFTFKDDPTTNREYFETTTASRLVVVQYETMHFTEIMLPTGKFYDAVSDDEGGGYSGDMREHIGKILLSHGIDLANYGISSSFSQTESPHPFTCAFMAAHNTVGMYQNGRIIHGWSGGNGMLTLYESIGNEMSHEVGHNYGLGHYVDGFLGSVHRPADQINSCWGWDSTKNMFVPNFSPAETGNDQCLEGQCEPAFLGKYQYGLDPMAMGDPMWGVNRFSLYTPNVSNRIQKFLEERAVWDPSSSTGFRKYDPSSGEMKEFVNRDNGNKVPRLYRVPVTTIVGYYEPNPDRSLESYIYPALHGAFGFVYDDDGTTSNGTPNGCELVVATNRGALVFDLILSIDPKGMNKFHVNVATEDEPSDAKVYCHNQLLAQRTLDKPKDVLTFTVNGIDFKSDLPTMPPTPSFNPPTFAPSRAPVVSPTVMPTIVCVDRDDLKFGKKKRGCAWIAKQRKKKIKKICKRKKWRSKKIREYWCPETCATIGLGPCATNGANAEQEDTIAI